MLNNETQNITENSSKDIGNKYFINFEENTIEKRSEIIGDILKYLRKKIGLSQNEIAKKIGIAQQTYAGYENGRHEPSIEITVRLANIYNTSMDYITGRYIGINEQKHNIEEYKNEEILEHIATHYEIQRLQDIEFMKMVRGQNE